MEHNAKIILDVLACIILLGGYFLHKVGKISHKFSIKASAKTAVKMITLWKKAR